MSLWAVFLPARSKSMTENSRIDQESPTVTVAPVVFIDQEIQEATAHSHEAAGIFVLQVAYNLQQKFIWEFHKAPPFRC